MHFLSEKDEKYAAKQAEINLTLTPDSHVDVVVVRDFHCECFLPNSFFLFP